MKRFIASLAGAAVLATALVAGAPAQAAPAPLPTPGSATGATTTHGKTGGAHKIPKVPTGHLAPLSNPQPCSAGTCYLYSGAVQTGVAADGGRAQLQVNRSYSPNTTGDHHTLTELAVEDSTLGNIVEVGVIRDSTATGDATDKLHLFVGCWVNGVFQGYNGGCSWTASGVAGAALPNADLTSAIGTTKDFAIEYFGPGSGSTVGWWVWYDGKWMGVFQGTAWTGAVPAVTTFGTQGANVVQLFTEVASTGTNHPCTDAGNGQLPSGASPQTATYTSLFNDSTGKTASWVRLSATDTAAYDSTVPTTTTMKMGGPGYDSLGLSPGNVGTCAPATAGTPAASSLNLWGEFCPDGQTSTACHSLGTFNLAALPLNTCVALNGSPATIQYDTKQYRNQGLAHTVRFMATTACTGSTFIDVANNTTVNRTFEPHAVKRIN